MKNLPTEQSLRKILDAVARAAQELGFAPEEPARPCVLAESPAEYGRKTNGEPRGKKK